MKTNKYYTPNLEEFCVGFEFEDSYGDGEYAKNSIDKLNIKDVLGSFLKKEVDIRVKCLDKQDLIELGFEYTEQYPIILDIMEDLFVKKSTEFKDFIITIKDNNVNISIKKDILLMAIPSDKKYWDLYCLFSGKIKNKSELKRVLKMIGAIE